MRRERMPQRMAGRRLGDASRSHRSFHCVLENGLVDVMTALFPAPGIDREARGRKGILPRPLPLRVWVFSPERSGKKYAAKPSGQIFLVLRLYLAKMAFQDARQIYRQHGCTVLPPF